MNTFANTLIEWYKRNKRALPWRASLNPYKIWISEIILQQTRVGTGLFYYERFIKTFPTITDLANADEDEVMKLWQGLGYYSRARNLHKSSKMVVAEFGGLFPSKYDDIIALPGVGPYTGAAVGSIAFGLRVAAVDGNVYRVLSRVFSIDTEINTGKAHKEFSKLALELMGEVSPGDFNQALMEFGALQCVPQSPNCPICPFNSMCLALRDGLIAELPVKKKMAPVKDRYLNYVVLNNSEHVCVQKRLSKDIWHSLYEFPLIETSDKVEEILMMDSVVSKLLPNYVSDFDTKSFSVRSVKYLKLHKLSHQRLHISIVSIDFTGSFLPKKLIKTLSDLPDLAFPKPLHNFIQENLLKQ